MAVDVLVIGAGMVGAACAYWCAEAGLRVGVLERGSVVGGTSSRGEGNILVSDKEPGAELDLVLRSIELWTQLGQRFGADSVELEAKGGVMVAGDPRAYAGLVRLAAAQRACGVDAVEVSRAELFELEPNLNRDVHGGVYYPQDLQVQPMLAAAELLRQARRLGATVHTGTAVVGFRRGAGGAVQAVATTAGEFAARWVVNAAGTWGGEIAAMAGAPVPVLPRRGVVLVTEPLPPLIRHKVYTAAYLANVASDEAGLETSAVVEGTRSGTVLIGASRERVGFDRRLSLPVVRTLAAQAIALFPLLADVDLLRTYVGFRPFCPDHLPVIGEDPRVPGLVHACGHEGAGIALSAVTGRLVAQVLTGASPEVDLTPFRPGRFAREAAG